MAAMPHVYVTQILCDFPSIDLSLLKVAWFHLVNNYGIQDATQDPDPFPVDDMVGVMGS